MYRIALIMYTQVATFGSLMLIYLGQSYITEGYGLYPILAGAIALLLWISPLLLPKGGE